MTFFQGLLKALAAAGSAGLVLVLRALIAFFQGTQPSDVSQTVWLGASFIGVLILNWAISKIPTPAA